MKKKNNRKVDEKFGLITNSTILATALVSQIVGKEKEQDLLNTPKTPKLSEDTTVIHKFSKGRIKEIKIQNHTRNT